MDPRFLNLALGIWLMFSPAVLAQTGAAADSARIAGPVLAALACVAIWEATRAVRWANVLVGAYLVAAPLFLDFGVAEAAHSVAVGFAAALVAAAPSRKKHELGGGWTSLFREPKDR